MSLQSKSYALKIFIINSLMIFIFYVNHKEFLIFNEWVWVLYIKFIKIMIMLMFFLFISPVYKTSAQRISNIMIIMIKINHSPWFISNYSLIKKLLLPEKKLDCIPKEPEF